MCANIADLLLRVGAGRTPLSAGHVPVVVVATPHFPRSQRYPRGLVRKKDILLPLRVQLDDMTFPVDFAEEFAEF
jgi:hypothetical protein